MTNREQQLQKQLEELAVLVPKALQGVKYSPGSDESILALLKAANDALDIVHAPAKERLEADVADDVDDDGYPSDYALHCIQEWPYTDFRGLVDYVKQLWRYQDFGWHQTESAEGLRLELSTAGWSGNESLVAALQHNHMFWMLSWRESKAGGHYVFLVPAQTGAAPTPSL